MQELSSKGKYAMKIILFALNLMKNKENAKLKTVIILSNCLNDYHCNRVSYKNADWLKVNLRLITQNRMNQISLWGVRSHPVQSKHIVRDLFTQSDCLSSRSLNIPPSLRSLEASGLLIFLALFLRG